MDQKQLLEQVLLELSLIKNGIPNGELKQVTDSVKDIKEDIADLKRLLLNPEKGVIVKVNKNTEFREEREAESSTNFKNIQDLQDLKAWKDTVTKALWIIFSALIGIVVKIIFFNE